MIKKNLDFNTLKKHLAFEARRSEGLRINFDPLGFFNVHMLCTRAFSYFASIKNSAAAAGDLTHDLVVSNGTP